MLEAHEYLSSRKLAKHLNVNVISPANVKGLTTIEISKLLNFDVWSAVTLTYDESHIIILNNGHSPVRQESDLFHELAHILCKHEMSGFIKVGEFLLRNYDQDQEDEAEWLGGCLHIPRKALEWAFSNNIPPYQIANQYYASESMLMYRINKTGIKNQYRYYARDFL